MRLQTAPTLVGANPNYPIKYLNFIRSAGNLNTPFSIDIPPLRGEEVLENLVETFGIC